MKARGCLCNFKYFNGTYQLWIPKQVNADLDGKM